MNNNEKQQIHDMFYADRDYIQNEKALMNDFIVKLQVAKYDAKVRDDPFLIFGGLTEQKQSVFILQGKLQTESNAKDVCYYMLSQLQNQKNQEFYIIYINTDLYTHIHLSQFYSVFKTFPVTYYENLQKILIVHGNFFIKSWFWFQNSVQIRVLKRKTVYLSKVVQLLDHQFFKLQQFEKLPLYCRDSTYSQLQQAISSNQLQQISNSFKQIYALELDQYEMTKKGIPLILDLCISKVFSDPKNLQIEGIFRLSASQSQEKIFEQYIVQQQFQEILDFENIIVIVNFIKRVLDKLKYSVVPHQFYSSLCSASLHTVQSASNIISQFPQLNKNLFTLIILMLNKVAQYQDQNKMGAMNLAILFGISLCRPEEFSSDDVQLQYLQVKQVNLFIQFVIENSSQIFPNQTIMDYLTEAEEAQQQQQCID